jgi:hypothetical protein
MTYDPAASRYVTLVPGGATNPTFTLSGGEELIVYQIQDHQAAVFTVDCVNRNLQPGLNLTGFSCPPDGYTAFDLLDGLGSLNAASIQRYNAEKGSFEFAGFNESGQTVGVDFQTLPGEGYFINMNQSVGSFLP